MNIYEKIKNGDYETKFPFPNKPLMKCLNCGNNAHYNGRVQKFCPNCGLIVKDYYELAVKKYTQDKLDYNSDRLRLSLMFKLDALQHCGIGNHKKADKAFTLAESMCDNMLDIVALLEELAELMVD